MCVIGFLLKISTIQYYTLPLLSPPTGCEIGGKIYELKRDCQSYETLGTVAHCRCEEIEKPTHKCCGSGYSSIM